MAKTTSTKYDRVAALVQTDEFKAHEEAEHKSESNARLRAKKLGLELRKSRVRKRRLNNQGGYMLVITLVNGVYRGENYELDLDDVDAILTEAEAR